MPVVKTKCTEVLEIKNAIEQFPTNLTVENLQSHAPSNKGIKGFLLDKEQTKEIEDLLNSAVTASYSKYEVRYTDKNWVRLSVKGSSNATTFGKRVSGAVNTYLKTNGSCQTEGKRVQTAVKNIARILSLKLPGWKIALGETKIACYISESTPYMHFALLKGEFDMLLYNPKTKKVMVVDLKYQETYTSANRWKYIWQTITYAAMIAFIAKLNYIPDICVFYFSNLSYKIARMKIPKTVGDKLKSYLKTKDEIHQIIQDAPISVPRDLVTAASKKLASYAGEEAKYLAEKLKQLLQL